MKSPAMPDVFLANDAEHADTWDDERPLVDAIRARGLSVDRAVWDDPHVDWSSARTVVLRYAFDYIGKRDEFCDWAGRLPNVHNPARLIRWNSHKAYLRELEDAGIATVPTEWLDAGATGNLSDILDACGWTDVVVKPAIDNGARGTLRVNADDLAPGQAHLEGLLARRDVMIQPYVAATEGPGEHKLIYLDGTFSHAIREHPRLGGVAFVMDRITRIDPEPDEIALAEQVLALIAESPLLYARVDVVMDEGIARLMELEVIEPVLFFSKAPGSAERMADAIAARI
ncbi:MAG: ATP-grasp domain-containing protein [Actinomycetota bacterium]